MSSKSSSANTTNNNTTNYNLQGVEGQNVVAGNGNTVTSTDYGSVNAAIGLANSAISSNQILALASVDHSGDMADLATEKTAEAWSGASKMLNDASSANADRVQQMAVAVATDGQNLIAENNTKNLYVVGGVSAVAVISMMFMMRAK